MARLVEEEDAPRGGVGLERECWCCGIWPGGGVLETGRPSGVWMLAVDLRFPNPKPLRREFIELIRAEQGVEKEDKCRTAGGGWKKRNRAWARAGRAEFPVGAQAQEGGAGGWRAVRWFEDQPPTATQATGQKLASWLTGDEEQQQQSVVM